MPWTITPALCSLVSDVCEVGYTLFAKNGETNILTKKCVSEKPIHEQRTAFYTLFVIRHSFRGKLFRCKPTTNIPFQFHQKTASPVKQRRKKDSPKRWIMVYTLFVFRLLFIISLVFRRYSQIVYSGLDRLDSWKSNGKLVRKILKRCSGKVVVLQLITVAVAPLAADILDTVAWSVLRAYGWQQLSLLLLGSFDKRIEFFLMLASTVCIWKLGLWYIVT